MIRAVEKFYTVQQLAWLLEFAEKTVRRWAQDGVFGPDVVNIDGKDVRIPASGVNAWLEQHRLLARAEEPVAARSTGELVRKVAERNGDGSGH